jgi:endoglucanase
VLLTRLSEAAGIPGQEGEVRGLIRSEVGEFADEIRVDPIGNLIVLKRGRRGGRSVMVAAHMDEVGLMVVGFDSSGLLHFKTAGGVDPRVLVSKTVLVGRNKYPGVIGSKPVHLQKKDEMERTLEVNSLFIDIGAKDKDDAKKMVNIGEQAVFATKCEPIGEGFIKGKGFDDRAGCAVLVEALRTRYDFDLWAVFTAQEETGVRGAGVAAHTIRPDLALVLDGTTAHDLPKTPEHARSSIPGLGPVIVHRDKSVVADRRIVSRLVEVAEASGIPYQFKRSITGGTDAGKIHQTGEGIPTGVLSIPCRFIHSPVSVMSTKDFANHAALVGRFLASLDERGWPV